MLRLLLAALATLGVGSGTISDFLIPVSYDLKFTLHLDDPSNGFVGSNVMQFRTAGKIARGITTVVLNSLELKITSATIHYPSQKRFTIKQIDYNKEDETVTLSLDQELSPNSYYTLELEYEGLLNGTEGFFVSEVNNENFLGTNAYPVYAKRIYPCFDKPNLRAKYNIHFEIHYTRKNDPTIITGLSGSYRVLKKDYKWFVPYTKYLSGNYSSSIDLPPYGFFFTVGDYTVAQEGSSVAVPNDPSYINIINPDLLDVETTEVVQSLSKNVDFYIKLVVVPGLPVPSVSGYGIAGLNPDVGKAVSDYSSKTLKDQALEMLKAALKTFFATVVSPASWEHVWLAESIPNYIAHAALNQMTTTWKNWPKIEVQELQQYALSNSWSSSSSPVIPRALNTTDDVLKFLSDPAIVKGSAILGMLETLTTNQLTSFVGFVNQFKGKAVSSGDFFDFYQHQNGVNRTLPTGKDLQTIFSPWLTTPGYPYLTVHRTDHEVLVNKKPFGTDSSQQAWMLPLSYKTIYLNATRSNTIALSDANFFWLDDKVNGNYSVIKDQLHNLLTIFNVHGPCPYRVLYDKSSLIYLTEKLESNVDFLKNEFFRSTLISDNFAFARRGLTTYTSLFDTLEYLASERSLGPWLIASERFRDLWSLLYFSDLRVQFQNYVTGVMRPSYLYYGIDPGNADMEKGMIRKEIIKGMCDYGDEACRADTKSTYNTYVVGKKSIANSDLIEELYCNGLRDVVDSQIRRLLKQKYSSSLAQYQKKTLFYYLSCSGGEYSNSEAIKNLLEDVLVSSSYQTMPADDMLLAFKEIVNKPQHYEEALIYFIDNFYEIRSTLEESHRVELIRHLGSLGSTDEHLSIFGNFTFLNTSDSTIVTAVQEAIKSIESRKQFMIQHYQDIYDGLYGAQPPTDSTPTPTPNTPSVNPDTPTSSTETPKPNSSPISAAVLPALLALSVFMLRYLV